MDSYREDLPPIPSRILKLPVERGYPVPWFVALIDGKYDFRIADASKMREAMQQGRCWTCGEDLGRYMTFAIGPMCAINHVSSEPPSHTECAEFSARACPFLLNKEPERRSDNLPEAARKPGGYMIMRQPGVTLLWTTREYQVVYDADRKPLFRIGQSSHVSWWREGRLATRQEVIQSIQEGLPILTERAEKQGPSAVRQLKQQTEAAILLLPVE